MRIEFIRSVVTSVFTLLVNNILYVVELSKGTHVLAFRKCDRTLEN